MHLSPESLLILISSKSRVCSVNEVHCLTKKLNINYITDRSLTYTLVEYASRTVFVTFLNNFSNELLERASSLGAKSSKSSCPRLN